MEHLKLFFFLTLKIWRWDGLDIFRRGFPARGVSISLHLIVLISWHFLLLLLYWVTCFLIHGASMGHSMPGGCMIILWKMVWLGRLILCDNVEFLPSRSWYSGSQTEGENHLGSVFKCRSLGVALKGWFQRVWGVSRNPYFQERYQVVLVQVLSGPRSEKE